jgi:hypothetical protein
MFIIMTNSSSDFSACTFPKQVHVQPTKGCIAERNPDTTWTKRPKRSHYTERPSSPFLVSRNYGVRTIKNGLHMTVQSVPVLSSISPNAAVLLSVSVWQSHACSIQVLLPQLKRRCIRHLMAGTKSGTRPARVWRFGWQRHRSRDTPTARYIIIRMMDGRAGGRTDEAAAVAAATARGGRTKETVRISNGWTWGKVVSRVSHERARCQDPPSNGEPRPAEPVTRTE